MSTTYFFDWQKRAEVPGRVTFLEGNGGLPKIEISTSYSIAEIYLQGAHVTRFQKKGEEPLLFMSEASRFERGHPVRGGIPVIFPWFGPRGPGFARVCTDSRLGGMGGDLDAQRRRPRAVST